MMNSSTIDWDKILRLLPGYDPFKNAVDSFFEPKMAERAIFFIEKNCRHIEGALAGQPFLLQDWQKSFVGNLFGWLKKDNYGRIVRRYREALLYVPRKSGKTPLVAAIALYVFFCDNEKGIQGYIAAADREQAAFLFRQAKGMVEQCPAMKKRCIIYGGDALTGQPRSLIKKDGSYLKVISADAETKHGGNSHLVIVDELHAQPSRDLLDVLATSMASANRAQPLLICLTTADYDRPSICNEKYDYATKVISGLVKDSQFLPAIYECSPTDDWTDPQNWRKANPNLGISVSEEYLARECERAKVIPAYESTFKRLHLNMRTQSANKLIDLVNWDKCYQENLPDLTGSLCWGGMDLSSSLDLSAVVWLFQYENKIVLIPKFYAPEDKADYREKTDKVPYRLWAQQGWLTLTSGSVIDYDIILKDIEEHSKKFQIVSIAADPHNATHALTILISRGIDVVQFRQGMLSYNAPTKRFQELIMQGPRSLIHDGNPVMRWMIGHLMVETDKAGNQMPSKKKSSDRIDGPVAAIMALGKMMDSPYTEIKDGGLELWE